MPNLSPKFVKTTPNDHFLMVFTTWNDQKRLFWWVTVVDQYYSIVK